jgi:5'-nucleotidase (lipoprotein e(P4) family)
MILPPLSSISLTLILLLGACATQAPRPDAAATAPPTAATVIPAAEPSVPAPNDNLNAVAWQQTSVEAMLISEQAYRNASDRLDAALRDKNWDALPKDERITAIGKLPPAVVLDVDETVLDNSPYQARLIRDGKGYNEATWADWVREEAARAIPGALAFAKAAAAKGIRVIYLSNRAQDLNDATLDNLRKLGFPVADKEVFLGLGTFVDGCEQNGTEKTCRRQLVGRKYRVLMQFGDQLGDFVGIVANTTEGRSSAAQPYLGWIGERWFVLPNPTYGSWEPALFNNSWEQPAGERRRQKIEALRAK